MSSIYSYSFKQELEEEILKELKIFMEYIDIKDGKLHPTNLPGEEYQLFDEPDYTEVYHPEHYNQGDIECIDAITAATVNKTGIEAVCVANVIKYLWRYEKKGGKKDVEKASWYLEKLLENL